MSNIRVMPNNQEAEESILGSVMIESKIISVLVWLIKTEDFYCERLRDIWNVMINLYNNKISIDLLTVSDELTKNKKIDDIWWVWYLAELTSVVPTATNFMHYAKIVKDNAIRRKIIKYWYEITEKWYKEDEDINDTLNGAKKDLIDISIWTTKLKPESFEELKKIPYDVLREKNVLKKKWQDYILQSQFWMWFERWSHIVIWALPSHWKSTFILNLLLDFAKQGYKVLYVNIEMTKKQVMDRIYAYLTWIDSTIFKYMEKDNILELLSKWEKEFWKFWDNFYLLTSWTITSQDVASIVAEMKVDGWIDIHWVDYIWILSDKAQHKVEQMVIASNTLRWITKDFNTVWLIATQFSKEWYKAKTPTFAHVKDSQTIFDDADVALVIHRKKTQEEAKNNFPWESTHNLIIEKNRSWNIWTKKLNFTFNTLRFELIDKK